MDVAKPPSINGAIAINGAIEQKNPETQSIDFWAMPKLSHFHQKTSRIADHR